MLNHTTDVLSANRNRLHVMFFGTEYYALIMNRTYLIMVTDHMISGANVIGLASAPTSKEAVDNWRNPFMLISSSTIRKYENIVPEMPEFLAAGSSNFQINIRDIADVSFKAKRRSSMGAVPHCGTLTIKTMDGKKRDFIVIGQMEGKAIEQRILSLRDRPPSAFVEEKDTILEAGPERIKVLLSTIGHEMDFDLLLQQDRVQYEKLPAAVSVFQAENMTGFLDAIQDKSFDIIHMLVKIDSNTGVDGYSTQELTHRLRQTNAKLVISAYGNQNILKNVSEVNLLMTIDRQGDGFSRCCARYFDLMLRGSSILQAYTQIVPQDRRKDPSQDFKVVFLPGGGDYRFFSTNLIEKLYMQAMQSTPH